MNRKVFFCDWCLLCVNENLSEQLHLESHSPEWLMLCKLSFQHWIRKSIPYCNSSLTDSYFVRLRFVYKFVCDLKNLLGYSAGELSRLVLEAEEAATDAEPGTNGGH